MQSSLYLADATFADTPGYKIVATFPVAGKVLVHAAPGAPLLAGMVVVRDGSAGPWSWQQLYLSNPTLVERVLRCVWLTGIADPITGEPQTASGTIADCRAAAKMTSLLQTNLVPHQWAGEAF